ncbi:hypothetical protein Rsub_13114 [Raphidocelis subcapitata]|uniref:DUF5672 domain-containing protein n=1 Tax=Raphidocelis subcapitata TaxID=307507 RepID=A0A2V0PLP3_9CHLO|nr:hypothetical protein Rsub_13114 [Raphidocelis subcapitata]|eukprot:GBF99982.1 hypothetical protein Rsub_13114 [Raphidocelis subcapitata]
MPAPPPAAPRAARAAAAAALLLGPLLLLPLLFGSADPYEYWELADDLIASARDWRTPDPPRQAPLPPLPPSPSRAAVLIETKAAAKLPAVVANAAAVLPPDWRLQLFLSEAARALAAGAPELAPLLASGRAFFSPLPEGYAAVDGWWDYQTLLLSRQLWRAVAGEHVLLFQLDTAMCAASPHKIGDYLSYDYVGAPWTRERWGDAPGGNGGLSLRRRSRMLAALDALAPGGPQQGGGGGPQEGAAGPPWAMSALDAPRAVGNEDQTFSVLLAAMGAHLPTRDVARTFAVETVFYGAPFGVHKFWAYMTAEQSERLFEFCPEARVAAAP